MATDVMPRKRGVQSGAIVMLTVNTSNNELKIKKSPDAPKSGLI